jgi:hypothetical protein
VAEVPFEAAPVATSKRPFYQRISGQVEHLHDLALSLNRIAAHLGVTD